MRQLRLREYFTPLILGVAVLLEMILIASQDNNKFHPHKTNLHLGRWHVMWSHHATAITSWTVAVLVGLALIRMLSHFNLMGLVGLLGSVLLVELLWGRILPRPQNTWEFALAFVLGAVAMFWHVLSESDVIVNTRARIQNIWHPA